MSAAIEPVEPPVVLEAEGTDVAVLTHAPLVQLGTLRANTPKALVEGATAIANTLADIIRSKKLSSNIQGREYVRVEGWTVLGALLGVIAREESVVEREDGSYLATVTLVRMADSVVVSRASAECNMDEELWAKRAKYTRRSMALTRATGKAARLAFSWIMALAGFEATPLEEMPANPVSAPAADPTLVPGGKHKGRPWSEVSSDYLDYGAKSNKFPAYLRTACQAEIDRRTAALTSGIGEDKDIPHEVEAGVRG